MSIIGILVALIVMGVVFWAARSLIAAFKIPEPIATVVIVILVILCLLIVLSWLGVGTGIRVR